MITENDKWNIEKGTYFIHSLSSNTLYASVMAVILQRPVIVIRIINLFAVCKCTNIQWTNFFTEILYSLYSEAISINAKITLLM